MALAETEARMKVGIFNIIGDEYLKPLEQCRLCGHGCGVNRLAGETGRCGAGSLARVAEYLLHHGEEPPLSGARGSGAIFFTGCPLACVFCQNYQISQEARGREISVSRLAGMMLDLEQRGAHNINLVSPTSWIPQIIAAVTMARESGLKIPRVYNSGGFDSVTGLKALEGIVDIYLPDVKFYHRPEAFRYSGAANYPEVNRAALGEMFRQAGPLKLDEDGLAVSGVLIRHLVLPGNLAQTDLILAWLAAEFGNDIYLSLMAQYGPAYRVVSEPGSFPELARPLTANEYETAIDLAISLGFDNVFIQEIDAAEHYRPDFDRPGVFK